MTAKLILPHDAPPAEWLEARRAGVTASEIAALMGISPYESPLSLYHRKIGDLGEQPDTDAMSLGRYLESWVAGWFEQRHPEFLLGPSGLYANTDRPWQLATPDRPLYERAHVDGSAHEGAVSTLECKTDASYDGWGDDGSDDIPAHYRAQTLWQMDVLGLSEVRVACLFLHSRTVREYVIARDDQAERDLELMRHEAETFLHRLDQGDPPPVDSHPATTDTLKALHPDVDDVAAYIPKTLAEDYQRARRSHARAEKRKKLIENRMRDRMGRARYAFHGDQQIATRSVFPRQSVDTKRLKAEHPEAYADCLTTTTVNQLRAKENK